MVIIIELSKEKNYYLFCQLILLLISYVFLEKIDLLY